MADVMEGKAVLFKKFAGIDVFDIEVNETDEEREIAQGVGGYARPMPEAPDNLDPATIRCD